MWLPEANPSQHRAPGCASYAIYSTWDDNTCVVNVFFYCYTTLDDNCVYYEWIYELWMSELLDSEEWHNKDIAIIVKYIYWTY